MATYSSLNNHIIKNIKSWMTYICYVFSDFVKKDEKFYITKNEDKIIDLSKLLFKNIYTDEGLNLIWDEKSFINLYKHCNDNDTTCEYCNKSLSQLKSFYYHVQSDRYTRGKSFEIDRKVGRMKDYPYAPSGFVEKVKEEIKQTIIDSNDFLEENKIIQDAFIWLFSYKTADERLKDKIGTIDEEILYLPAPYTEDNCVLACYWCNNAKTDAFTFKEFTDYEIGTAIGNAIDEILNKSNKETD